MAEPFKSGIAVVVGGANVGKSTLVNALAGEKIAVVSDKPQTTRLRTLAVKHDARGQILLMDTPGITEPRLPLETRLVNQALKAIGEADLLIFVVDATKAIGPWEETVLARLPSVQVPILLVINKMDLVTPERIAKCEAAALAAFPFTRIFKVSARDDENLGALEAALWDLLPEGPPYYPPHMTSSLPLPLRIGEIIREKVMVHTREEIPHATAVSQVDIEEQKDHTRVTATLIVEHESQKGILIGKGGRMLKLIGQEARAEIEPLVGKKVFLELWVKVKEKWRRRDDLLNSLGFGD